MAVKEFPAGMPLLQSEQPLSAIHVIAKGCVKASFPGGEYYLHKGDVIGVCELFYGTHFIDYSTEEATAVASYAYSNQQLPNILKTNLDMANLFVTSMLKQFHEILDQYEMGRFDSDNLYQYLIKSYEDYVSACQENGISPRSLPELDNLTPLTLEEDVEPWLSGYYAQLRKLTEMGSIKNLDASFLEGLILKTNQDIYKVVSVCRAMSEYKAEIAGLLMNENRLDFFDLFASLLYKLGPDQAEASSLTATIGTMMIQIEGQPSIDKDMYNQRVAEYRSHLDSLSTLMNSQGGAADSGDDIPDIADSMNTILTYSGVEEAVATTFKNAIHQYSKLSDKNSSDDSARKLRLTITKLFYQIYEKAFIRSVHDFTVPKIIQMFFNFGYVDEHLAGMENAAYLYRIVDTLPSDPSKNVYTIYEWLQAIYSGQKTPCRNEFDVDYMAHIHELKVGGKITAEEEMQLQKNYEKQVLFEIQNMFPSVNKMTFGRISTFCPVFSEHNLLKDLSSSLVSAQKVTEAFDQVRSVDYSAYYRDTVYTNPDLGIGKEYISVEVLPDVILMPNIGIRGVMWQEIEGRKRTTPARMMVSIFQMEDLTNLFVRLTGEFRWEMCKRIQGARWNDVTDSSLTSEYFDYIQFYKKNRDLSVDAKDKIKLAMQKAKNSFKEMFIRDYETWILYEGAGSPRMNKVARTILFTYCPFNKEVREKLKSNPLYKETLERYDVKLGQKIHHYDNMFQKLRNMNAEIPDELKAQRKYLDK